ncbi:MAG: acylphosphatase [Pyrinomonadaceae bacterium]
MPGRFGIMIIGRTFLFSGNVQGVGFRFFAQRVAARYQIRGYVKNLDDGRVEALAQGVAKSVEAFKQDLTAGPRFSKVENVEEIVVEPNLAFSSFRIER